MKRALHMFAVNGKSNSGDFFLGPSTKYEFEKFTGEEIKWANFDVRREIQKIDIKYINQFDYIVIGGGGLFLPDTNPNKISCWQWPCSSEMMRVMTPEVYVIGIGWNHFYGQDITMPNRGNDYVDPERASIFKKNVETLLDVSKSFTMRHNGDVERLREIVDQKWHKKIKYSPCPVLNYIKSKYSSSFKSGEHITFEIKDDRPNRRYLGTSRQAFYDLLYSYILKLRSLGEKIAIMSHDGSNSFIGFLMSKGFSDFVVLNNTVANEEKIIQNYSKVKKLYCTAGHSQITAYALGLDSYSLVCHDKLLYFLSDVGKKIPEDGCLVKDLTLEILIESCGKE